MISFAGGLPAPELFDAAGLRESFAAVLSDGAAHSTLQYSTTEGNPRLRAAVAARLTARGLPTEADELLVCSGSQQALTLTATALLEPGDVVLTEEPSYLAALQCFGLAGARTVGVACDEEGLDPDALEVGSDHPSPEGALSDSQLSEPDRPNAAARAARGRRRAGRPPRAVDHRGRPLQRASLPRRSAAGDRDAARRRGPHPLPLDALQDGRSGTARSAGSGLRPSCGRVS